MLIWFYCKPYSKEKYKSPEQKRCCGYTNNENEDEVLQELKLEDTESARFLGLDVSMIDEYKNQVSAFMKDFKGLFA